jgi:diacylglycerol kinase family enzyme
MPPVPTAQPSPVTTESPFGPITVIADASAGGAGASTSERIEAARSALVASGLPHTIDSVSGPDQARRAARAAFDEGTRFVVALGDDRTVHELVNAAFRDGATIVEQPVIGLVPVAGCDLARCFGLPDDVDRAVGHLAGTGTYPLDVMKVTATDRTGDRIAAYGHNVVQIGLRAAVAAKTRAVPAGTRVRRFAAFWRVYARWRRCALTIHVDARTHEVRAWDVLVANGQFVDDGLRLSPRSYPGDGVLDALAFVGPKSDAYRMLPRIFMNGGHLPDPGVKELRAKIRVSVEGQRAWPVVVDGRFLGTTPVTIQVVPRRVLLKL